MKNLVRPSTIGNLAFILVFMFCGLSAHAASGNARLMDYLNRSFYEKELFTAAVKEAIKDSNCDGIGTKVARDGFKVMKKIRFTKKRAHPVEGVWMENTHVILCGKSVDVKVTIIARPNYGPVFLAKKD